jgi:hypothetical protein
MCLMSEKSVLSVVWRLRAFDYVLIYCVHVVCMHSARRFGFVIRSYYHSILIEMAFAGPKN